MKEGYIPREKRKKILMLSDDIRTHSGVGNMARSIVVNTSHYFNWANLGGAVQHPDNGKVFDFSNDINNLASIEDAYTKIYCVTSYGDSSKLREVIKQEKPDAIVHFTDPRYWVWLYQMENEIRQKCPLIFYTIWDDVPYPMWNRDYYRSDDMLLCISKQTKNLVENVLRDFPKPGHI